MKSLICTIVISMLLFGCTNNEKPLLKNQKESISHDILVPLQEVTHSYDWKHISTAGSYTLGIKKDGTLWMFGNPPDGTYHGILPVGFPSTTRVPPKVIPYYRLKPKQIGDDNDWQYVSAGSYAIAIKNDGTLWAWGANIMDRSGKRINSASPMQLNESKVWVAVHSEGIAGGVGECDAYTIGLKNDGTLWGWGTNGFNGLLGLVNKNDAPILTQITKKHNWSKVSMGCYSVIALSKDGTAWGWGTDSEIRDISSKVSSKPFLPMKMDVKAKLGGDIDSIQNAIFSDSFNSARIKNDGTLWLWRYEESPKWSGQKPVLRQEKTKNTDWKWLSQHDSFVIALKKDGSLWFFAKE